MTVPLPDEDAQLAALGEGFPEFTFTVINTGGKRCFEAVRGRGRSSLYSVNTTDATELWQILRDACAKLLI